MVLKGFSAVTCRLTDAFECCDWRLAAVFMRLRPLEPHLLALGVEILDEALQEVHALLHVDLVHLQQVLRAQGRSLLLQSHDRLSAGHVMAVLTSHICSWKRRRSFSMSSAISPPLNSVRIIPCCLACSRFSFSIFALPGSGKGVRGEVRG